MAMEAYVLLRTHGREKEIRKYLEQVPLVREAKIIYGEYDIILHVVAGDMKELTHLVLDDIRRRFDIDRTSTLIVAED